MTVLSPDEATFPYRFSLRYVITLGTHRLSTDLHVHNTSTDDTYMEFQALLQDHLVCDSAGIATHSAQTKGEARGFRSLSSVVLREERGVWADFFLGCSAGRVFKVHSDAGGYEVKTTGFKDVNVALGAEDGWSLSEEERSAKTPRHSLLPCTTIPSTSLTRPPAFLVFAPRGSFVCVKPGLTLTWHTLAPGDTWVGTQTITPSLPKAPSACNIQ